MANDTHCVLCCFIKGDSTVFQVTAPGKASRQGEALDLGEGKGWHTSQD